MAKVEAPSGFSKSNVSIKRRSTKKNVNSLLTSYKYCRL